MYYEAQKVDVALMRLFNTNVQDVFLTNTLSGNKEVFVPLKGRCATIYSCGPTVYGPAHIGNLRSYIFSDTLARTLIRAGYSVKRVINITDVGHLVGDGDEGEDKMSVGAAREKTTPEEIAHKYETLFKQHIRTLNIETKNIQFPRATGFIREQIRMVKTLEKKGYAYKTKDGVYFDTSRFPEYGVLGGVKDAHLKAGARVHMGDKRSFHDFALWRLAKPGELQQWNSPWGRGNPGWSIECSAMATTLLGNQIDIHTGGEDHIHIHHNNEIAQSECATGVYPFVRVWMHNAFISIEGEKISKSLGNTFTLDDVIQKGIHPLALRFLYLQAHYRTPLSFSWESLTAAQTALETLWDYARQTLNTVAKKTERGTFSEKFEMHMRNDLDTAGAMAFLFTILSKKEGTVEARAGLIHGAETYLGLSLTSPPKTSLALNELPTDIQELARHRTQARELRDFKKSDELRQTLLNRGYRVEDRPSGTTYKKL